ncbi:MAG: (d)CMP kinase [Clostridia bacterium]|nr:(d)CMP kinase [Clostridia bacterium]
MMFDMRYMRLQPVLERIAALTGDRLLITIDGPCGSGKSTLAKELAAVTGADVVHMDDFVIPYACKTAERLAQPGGNADVERLMTEVLQPWIAAGYASYRPYLCHTDALGETAEVCGRILILEGSYANLPPIREIAALRLFIRVPANEQQERLLKRVGPARLQTFNERWIPLENAYFSAFELPDPECMLIAPCYDQAE